MRSYLRSLLIKSIFTATALAITSPALAHEKCGTKVPTNQPTKSVQPSPPPQASQPGQPTISGLTAGMPASKGYVLVQNRILAKVNGTAISAFDVAKKLDFVFLSSYPQYATMEEAKYEFYQAHWREALNDLIEEKLVLADSTDKNIPISNGDIREEMEARFGPNLMARLDQMGVTYEQAFEMVKTDLIVSQMLGWRVNSKALCRVGPKEIRSEYEKYVQENSRAGEFNYRVITFKDEDTAMVGQVAKRAHEILEEENNSPEALLTRAAEEWSERELGIMSISEEFIKKANDLSSAHKEVVTTLAPGSNSGPIVQSGRQGDVTRIYCLTQAKKEELPPLSAVERKIQSWLINQAAAEEKSNYFNGLKKQFHLQDYLSTDTTPFEFIPHSVQS
jgi:hypothetical protein